MLMINKEAVRENIVAIKEKLADSGSKDESITEVKKLIEMKQSHLWRADVGSCCGSICNLSSQIEIEIGILQQVIEAIERKDNNKAVSLLENYLAFVEEHYEDERPLVW